MQYWNKAKEKKNHFHAVKHDLHFPVILTRFTSVFEIVLETTIERLASATYLILL